MSYVFALEAMSVEDIILHPGDVWAADDPFVKAHPDLFSNTPPRVRRTSAPVEQATAAPGEKRRRG